MTCFDQIDGSWLQMLSVYYDLDCVDADEK
jgi:hypothetical protein